LAASIKVYGHLGVHLAQGDLDWDADDILLALCTSSYVVSQANDEFFTDVTHELAGTGGYTSGGVALAGKSRSYDAATREERFLADDISIAALTPSSPFRYGVVYQDTGDPDTSILVCFINFGADQDPAGLPFAIQWAATGVLYAQAS
jgi:hypothetical protein